MDHAHYQQKAEYAKKRSEEQLADIETRLQEAEAQNRALMNALEQSGFKFSGTELGRDRTRELTPILKVSFKVDPQW